MLIIVGLALLLITWYDYRRDETAIYLWGFSLGVDRDNHPLIFRAAIALNSILGLWALAYGLLTLRA